MNKKQELLIKVNRMEKKYKTKLDELRKRINNLS